MSAEVIAMLARRWDCSVEDVGHRIGLRLQAAGLIDPGTATTDKTVIAAHFAGVARWLTLGVTDDDRIFVLDAHDRPLLEL